MTPVLSSGARARDAAVSLADLSARAADLAARPYAPAADDLPEALGRMSYDAYQATRFRREAEIPLGERFGLQLFPRGFLHRRRVGLNLVRPAGAEPSVEALAFDPRRFDTAALGVEAARLGPGLGHAGFRIHHAYDGPGAPGEEFAVFLGASYFRLIGRGQEYGLSARAVAVGTGLPAPEEFPAFTEFWIEEPGPGAGEIAVTALLDGPSLAGAYAFRLRPGTRARVEVQASLHPRGPIPRLGLAPLTSMFLRGKLGPEFDDVRPEVHDSDGLMIVDADGPSWRALDNPRPAPRFALRPASGLRSFGLLQRERDFRAYLDVEARHEGRPGLTVEPRSGFGEGEVALYEINSREEYMDNVVAFFAPREPARAGVPIEVAYALTTSGAEPEANGLGRAVGARVGSAERLRPTQPPSPERRMLMVDFEGGLLPELRGEAPAAEVAASGGRLVDPVVQRVPATGGWRVYVEHRAEGRHGEAEVSVRLTLGGRPVTETWRGIVGG